MLRKEAAIPVVCAYMQHHYVELLQLLSYYGCHWAKRKLTPSLSTSNVLYWGSTCESQRSKAMSSPPIQTVKLFSTHPPVLLKNCALMQRLFSYGSQKMAGNHCLVSNLSTNVRLQVKSYS
ncbi:hypothetical protein POM88_008803 [Heracleum sosnowskyi]|uniref:Uncharacterized protein n=1 Tax=Heracleum sosnowskyi TaxID=360622 RepID=A0AAD8N211_9APIA|nr:hypothetical protein POM88_008803 [Heracleum sosnowskyi]